jgi:hypothetical protein
MSSLTKALTREIEDLLISAIWTHQIQEKQTIITMKIESLLKISQIAFSAIIGSTAIIDFINNALRGKLIIAIISAIMVINSSILKSNSFSHKAELHKLASARLWKVRQCITADLVDNVEMHISDEMLRGKREYYINEMYEISKQAPKASYFAKKWANHALKIEGVSTVSEEERKILLPQYLKVNNIDI